MQVRLLLIDQLKELLINFDGYKFGRRLPGRWFSHLTAFFSRHIMSTCFISGLVHLVKVVHSRFLHCKVTIFFLFHTIFIITESRSSALTQREEIKPHLLERYQSICDYANFSFSLKCPRLILAFFYRSYLQQLLLWFSNDDFQFPSLFSH